MKMAIELYRHVESNENGSTSEDNKALAPGRWERAIGKFRYEKKAATREHVFRALLRSGYFFSITPNTYLQGKKLKLKIFSHLRDQFTYFFDFL